MNSVPGRRSLWVFDFDGTLASIVPDRKEARLHRDCERMLRFLARAVREFTEAAPDRIMESAREGSA